MHRFASLGNLKPRLSSLLVHLLHLLGYPRLLTKQPKLSVSQTSESRTSVKAHYRAWMEYFNVDRVLEPAAITSNENATFGLYAD
jgi:hypothetical protein